ncbi:hypothetical protein ACFFX1_21735 [Dactylosporangium sucinum]|uniref:Uncharacterized protein n=1 Tax=Dactylosporangium sucinum TaxID=1424081 RepID=A0A917U9H3_9ACTN|nr:hypothetical protein [Dactylosporangium sucinum]GGM67450.1 hypothetical protein GCM10007977_081550 [Dactylosporangium sucinum]
MSAKEPQDGVLHRLTHAIPGVPEHDSTRGRRHQGNGWQHRRHHEKLNHKGGHGLHDAERKRRVLPGWQNMIARFFGAE